MGNARRLLASLIGLLALEARPAAANMAPPEYRTFILITELAVGGTHRCEGREDVWTDLFPMAGFTPLEVGVPSAWLAHEGHVVKMRARRPDSPRLSPARPMPCQEQQLRSDWVHSPRGFRQDRGNLTAPSPTLWATGLARWDGLRIGLTGDTVTVSLENRDIGLDLTGLRFVAHYEGCMKKPGATHEESAPFSLEVGATRTWSVPAFQRPAPPESEGPAPPGEPKLPSRAHGTYRLASIQVVGGNDEVLFLLDREVARDGVVIQCPER